MESEVVLIFSGYNDRAVIAFCRYATIRNIRFCIVSKGKDDLIYKTQYKNKIVYERVDSNITIQNILEITVLLKKKTSIKNIFILPSTEYLNRILIANKIILHSNDIKFGLCDKEIYELVSNKYAFGKLCESKLIKTPSEVSHQTENFPIVIKPKSYFNDKNEIYVPKIISSAIELNSFFEDKCPQDFYLQEYIKGNSIYFLYYIFSNKKISVYSQENFMQQHNGGSMILAQSSNYHSNKIATDFANLFVEIGFKGLVMVEVKFYNNQFYMIEANPRLWGPSQLILDAKMNLFDCFTLDNNLISKITEEEYVSNNWYFWNGGLSHNNKKELPIAYYNFDITKYDNLKNEISADELYNRPDTIELFKFENELND